jgi:hypothetical protein
MVLSAPVSTQAFQDKPWAQPLSCSNEHDSAAAATAEIRYSKIALFPQNRAAKIYAETWQQLSFSVFPALAVSDHTS